MNIVKWINICVTHTREQRVALGCQKQKEVTNCKEFRLYPSEKIASRKPVTIRQLQLVRSWLTQQWAMTAAVKLSGASFVLVLSALLYACSNAVSWKECQDFLVCTLALRESSFVHGKTWFAQKLRKPMCDCKQAVDLDSDLPNFWSANSIHSFSTSKQNFSQQKVVHPLKSETK